MTTTISDELLKSLLPQREIGAHKWGVGGVLVIAGSPAYPGASWLASRSAGRNGAGIVYLATPRSVIGTMASAMPEVAFVPIPDTESGAHHVLDRLKDALGKVRSIVIGPGLGDDVATDHLLTELFGFAERGPRSITGFGFGAEPVAAAESDSIFSLSDAQVVVDADGLNWLAKQDGWWEKVPQKRLVLTPHPGEANRLSGLDVEEITADPAGVARQLAKRWNQAVVIKSGYAATSDGKTTVVADIAPTSLATAGTGDCLAGAIGAFLAQGCSPVDAATLAIGIGGRAATNLEGEYGVAGVIATDLPDVMARVAATLS